MYSSCGSGIPIAIRRPAILSESRRQSICTCIEFDFETRRWSPYFEAVFLLSPLTWVERDVACGICACQQWCRLCGDMYGGTRHENPSLRKQCSSHPRPTVFKSAPPHSVQVSPAPASCSGAIRCVRCASHAAPRSLPSRHRSSRDASRGLYGSVGRRERVHGRSSQDEPRLSWQRRRAHRSQPASRCRRPE